MNSRGGAKRTADLATVRRWARLLDSEFRIPGTKLTFGLDPVIGLIPGVGDLVGPIFGLIVLAHAWRMRVPKIVMARMVINAGLDALLGIIPLIGDTVDLFWKANLSNVTLLERHAYERGAVTTADRVFVAAVIIALLLLLLLPIALVIWIGRGLF
jgi:hypothetical protein